MAGTKPQPATNQRIVELLEEVRAQLADLVRLLERRRGTERQAEGVDGWTAAADQGA